MQKTTMSVSFISSTLVIVVLPEDWQRAAKLLEGLYEDQIRGDNRGRAEFARGIADHMCEHLPEREVVSDALDSTFVSLGSVDYVIVAERLTFVRRIAAFEREVVKIAAGRLHLSQKNQHTLELLKTVLRDYVLVDEAVRHFLLELDRREEEGSK